MCLAMYLFTDNNIGEIEWDKNNPKMYIKNIKLETCRDDEKNLYKWNENNKKIYYIGSYEGCGCGWTNLYSKSFKKEIKHYLKEINNFKIEIHNINDENMRKLIKNKIEICEDSIKNIIKKVNDRNDLFNLLRINNDNGAFIIICWEGDQGKEIDKKIHLNIEKIKKPNYEFHELVKYILK